MKKKFFTFYFAALFLALPFFKGLLLYTVTISSVILGIIVERKSIKIFKKKHFILFLFLIVLLYPILPEEKNSIIFGIRYSREALFSGVQMVLRGISLFLWLNIFTMHISIGEIVDFFKKTGFTDFGVKLALALNILPILDEEIGNIKAAFLLRTGSRKRVFLNTFRISMTILANVIRRAEEISIALALKGYSNERESDTADRTGGLG